MKIGSWLALMLAICTASSWGEEAGGKPEGIAEILAPLIHSLQSVESIDYSCQGDVVETELYYALHPSALATGGRTFALSLRSAENKYRYKISYSELDQSGNREFESAFDGSNYQKLNVKTDTLFIGKNDPSETHLSLGLFNPLNLFGFLAGGFSGNKTITLGTITNPSILHKFIQSVDIVGRKVEDGKQLLTVKLSGVNEPYLRVPCIFFITLSEKYGYFPVSWKSVTPAGRLLMQYDALEMEQAAGTAGPANFYYPKKAVIKEFTVDPKIPADKVQLTMTVNVSEFKINSLSSEEEDFSIDPAKASQVVDLESNVAIPISR